MTNKELEFFNQAFDKCNKSNRIKSNLMWFFFFFLFTAAALLRLHFNI